MLNDVHVCTFEHWSMLRNSKDSTGGRCHGMRRERRVTADEALAVWTPRRKERVCWDGAMELQRKLASWPRVRHHASSLTFYQGSSDVSEGDSPLVLKSRVTRRRESEVSGARSQPATGAPGWQEGMICIGESCR